MTNVEYSLRGPTAEDLPLILSSWTRGAHECEPAKWADKDVFWRGQHDLIHRRMASAETMVVVHPGDEAEIIGYVCFEFLTDSLVIHWLYIKTLFRKLGLAKDLVKRLGGSRSIVATQASKHTPWILQKGVIFDPFFGWRAA